MPGKCDFRPTTAISGQPGNWGRLVRIWSDVGRHLRACRRRIKALFPLWERDLDDGGRLGGAVGAAVIPALGSAAAAQGVGAGGCWFCASDSERC